jgi:hypothetical protein
MKEVAAENWIKTISNKQLPGFEAAEPDVPITIEPVFPDHLQWHEIVHLAFRRRLIEKEDHPVIRRILGG